MSQRDISDAIEDIYGFELSHETVSEIADKGTRSDGTMIESSIEKVLYISVRQDDKMENYAVFTHLGYDVNSERDYWSMVK